MWKLRRFCRVAAEYRWWYLPLFAGIIALFIWWPEQGRYGYLFEAFRFVRGGACWARCRRWPESAWNGGSGAPIWFICSVFWRR